MILQATDENVDIKVSNNNINILDKNIEANIEVVLADDRHYFQLVIYDNLRRPMFIATLNNDLTVRNINYHNIYRNNIQKNYIVDKGE